MRAAHEHGMQHAVARHVVHEKAAPGDQARVFAA
jgi:hypothetical protein